MAVKIKRDLVSQLFLGCYQAANNKEWQYGKERKIGKYLAVQEGAQA